MGLFSFGKKVKLYAPVDGTLEDLSATDSAKGFSVQPQRHHLYSPVDGTVSALMPDQRAIELTSNKLKVRVQLDSQDGQTSTYVHEGDAVTPETPIMFMDHDDLDAAKVRVVVDNADTHMKSLSVSTSGQVSHDQEVATAVQR
ncbi:PTS glucose transporter subunit IIA [Lactiplantibacillus plajomi]|uniref:PTS glucose transporter subunit IIA n=1 Tax=Lactiplantibacillus plajomi TaxID=1457217 RepID=A0ABV6K4U5_9LACO|nr:PTS glucose transporter subunit IIA [Lactiplantibacillus plajomi]